MSRVPRRGVAVFVVATVAAAVTVASACSADCEAVSTQPEPTEIAVVDPTTTSPSTSPTTSGTEAVTETTVASPPPDGVPWVDLPPSPLGDWPIYNWAYLVDGTGLVQTGAASTIARDGDTTASSAIFSFDTGSYAELPDLPTAGGLASAAAAQVGDTLVVVGQDCLPAPGWSFDGQPLCPGGRERRRVTATYHRGDRSWEVRNLPADLAEFAYDEPNVLGVSDGRVILQTGDLPPRLGAFDPTTGRWDVLPDVPVADPDSDGSGLSFVGPTPRVCVLDGAVVSFVVGGDPTAPLNRWSRYDGERFVGIDPPTATAPEAVTCATGGVYVTRRVGPTDSDRDVQFANPVAGTVTDIGPIGWGGLSPTERQRGGSVVLYGVGEPLAPGSTSFDVPEVMRFATPWGFASTRIESPVVELLLGNFLMRTNDATSAGGRTGAPQMARVLD